MLRQYGPTVSRFRCHESPRGLLMVGVLPVGTICRPSINGQPLGKVMIEAWEPREITLRAAPSGRHYLKRMRGGHIAHVRCLKTSQRFRVSDAWLIDTDEA